MLKPRLHSTNIPVGHSPRRAVCAILVLLSGLSAMAGTKDWLGGTSTAWGTAANWHGGLPASGDTLLFGVTSGQSVVNSTLDLGAGTFTVGALAVNNTQANSVLQYGTLGASSYVLTNGTLTFATDGTTKSYGILLGAGVTLTNYATLNNQTASKGILYSVSNSATLNIQSSAASNDRFGFVAAGANTSATANINAVNWASSAHWIIGSDLLSLNAGSILQQNLIVNVNASQTPAASEQWVIGWTASGFENVMVIRNAAVVTHGSGNIVILGGANSSSDTSSGRIQIGDATTTGFFTPNSATATTITGYTGTGGTSLRMGFGGGTGTIDVNNGTLTLTAAGTLVLGYGGVATSKGVINLNSNGVIDTKSSFGKTTAGIGIFNFNGGTLKLNSGIGATQYANFLESGVTANVLDGGAIIDVNGKSATNNASLLAGGTGAGGLTVKSSGSAGSIGILTLNATNSYTGDTTLSNATLIIAGTSSLNGGSLLVGLNGLASTNIALNGAAVSVGSGPTNSLLVGYRTSSTAGAFGFMDVSALSNFTANVGNLLVGYNNNSAGSTVANGRLLLATNNTITATNIVIGSSPGTGSGNTNLMVLGSGTNNFTTPILTVGGPKENGTLVLNAGGRFVLGNGAGRTDLTVGNESAGTSVTPPASVVDLSGGTFIGTLGTLTVGLKSGAGTSGGDTGALTLGGSAANNVNVNTVNIGSLTGATTGSPVGQGTLTLGGGNFLVNSNVTLANYSGSFGSALGTLNINGGIFSVGGNLISGAGTSAINLNGGTLIATNAIGALASRITAFSITNSTLQISASSNLTNVAVTTLNAGGTANVIRIVSAPTNVSSATLPLISYVNYNGPTNFVPDFTVLSAAYPALSFAGTITTNNNVLVLNLTIHHPPVANADAFNRTAGLALKIKLTDLLANDTDADGNPLTLAGINLTTTNGVTLLTNDMYVFYPNSANVNDQFSYTITDGFGTATGLVSIVVVTNVTGQTTGNITVDGSHMVTVGFAGIPGDTYGVQRSTNLVDWATIWTTNAPAGGLFQYTDSFGDLGGTIPSSAYYRLSWIP